MLNFKTHETLKTVVDQSLAGDFYSAETNVLISRVIVRFRF